MCAVQHWVSRQRVTSQANTSFPTPSSWSKSCRPATRPTRGATCGPTPPSPACARSSSCIRRVCLPSCCGATRTATGRQSPRRSGL